MNDSIRQHERLVTGEVAGMGPVSFKCRWWSKDVTVELVSPCQGEKAYSHLPYMVPTKFGEGPDCMDWQDMAWQLVRKILGEYKWKQDHRELYEKRLAESRRKREEILGKVKTLKECLSQARRERSGVSDGAVARGSRVKQLKEEIRELESQAMQEEEWWWLPTLMKNQVK